MPSADGAVYAWTAAPEATALACKGSRPALQGQRYPGVAQQGQPQARQVDVAIRRIADAFAALDEKAQAPGEPDQQAVAGALPDRTFRFGLRQCSRHRAAPYPDVAAGLHPEGGGLAEIDVRGDGEGDFPCLMARPRSRPRAALPGARGGIELASSACEDAPNLSMSQPHVERNPMHRLYFGP